MAWRDGEQNTWIPVAKSAQESCLAKERPGQAVRVESLRPSLMYHSYIFSNIT